jgi:hypothetical protein
VEWLQAVDEPTDQRRRMNALPTLVGSDASDDATAVMQQPDTFSVHDEPTVIGQIPEAALEAERSFARATLPPPAPKAAEPPPAEPASLVSLPAPSGAINERAVFWLMAGVLSVLGLLLIAASLR